MTCGLYSICARTHTHTLTKELQQDVDWRNNRKQTEDAELVQKRKAIYVLTVLKVFLRACDCSEKRTLYGHLGNLIAIG